MIDKNYYPDYSDDDDAVFKEGGTMIDDVVGK